MYSTFRGQRVQFLNHSGSGQDPKFLSLKESMHFWPWLKVVPFSSSFFLMLEVNFSHSILFLRVYPTCFLIQKFRSYVEMFHKVALKELSQCSHKKGRYINLYPEIVVCTDNFVFPLTQIKPSLLNEQSSQRKSRDMNK